MKKLLSILLLFVFSIFIASSQQNPPPTVQYVDSLKQVVVTINPVDKKKIADQQDALVAVAGSNLAVSAALTRTLQEVGENISLQNQEIEERNKSDSGVLQDKFQYTPKQVKQAVSRERTINLIMSLLTAIYLLSFAFALNSKRNSLGLFTASIIWIIAYGLVAFLVLKFLLTVIFNGDYIILKGLSTFYP